MKYVITVSTKVQRREASCPTLSPFNFSRNDHAAVEVESVVRLLATLKQKRKKNHCQQQAVCVRYT